VLVIMEFVLGHLVRAEAQGLVVLLAHQGLVVLLAQAELQALLDIHVNDMNILETLEIMSHIYLVIVLMGQKLIILLGLQ
jgi:hypothetical protein